MGDLLLKILLLLAGGLASNLSAQVILGDDCSQATSLPPGRNYCSDEAAYTTTGTTASFAFFDYPQCFQEPTSIKDGWLSFVALDNSVSIQIIGSVPNQPSGTLEQPQLALLSEACDSLVYIGCRSAYPISAGRFQNGVTLIHSGLKPGEKYYLLVSAGGGRTGSFRICIDQFDLRQMPSGDCNTAITLCDNSTFATEFRTGRGEQRDNLLASGVACGGVTLTEFNASWYQWTCASSGELSFTLTPLGVAPDEDLDFILYELPNGLGDCREKIPLRFMFSGGSDGSNGNSPCLGSTGLRVGEVDTQENCGCDPGDNNFLRPVQAEAGRSYALVVMNFSGSNDGFRLMFDGTATVLGPDPDFAVDKEEVCIGDTVTFTDRSASTFQIARYEWDFGPFARPQRTFGPGPHRVVFDRPGQPEVRLSIETDRRCAQTRRRLPVQVICCQPTTEINDVIQPVRCAGESNGRIELIGANPSDTLTDFSFNWQGGQTSRTLTNLSSGSYQVTITDTLGCTSQVTSIIPKVTPFKLNFSIDPPTCEGGQNGSIAIEVQEGGTAPFEYRINNGTLSLSNTFTNLPVTTVSVQVRDANGCVVLDTVEINEVELLLVGDTATIVPPNCHGDPTGMIKLSIANGQPPYFYDFGFGETTQSIYREVAAGAYPITFRDVNGCRGMYTAIVTDPSLLQVRPVVTNVKCHGDHNGSLQLVPSGGTSPYRFAWSDKDINTAIRTELSPDNYHVTVTDANGCTVTITDSIRQPTPLTLAVVQQQNPPCFDEPGGTVELVAMGGTPPYFYGIDEQNFSPNPILGDLTAGAYQWRVQDLNDCIDTIEGVLTSPPSFKVELEAPSLIYLGEQTTLRLVGNAPFEVAKWQPEGVSCLDTMWCTNVEVRPSITTYYEAVVINEAGCAATATAQVQVVADYSVYIPTAFSPNGDGTNDYFTIYGGRAFVAVEQLSIWNRWGGEVYRFDGDGGPSTWDGTVNGQPAASGVYTYRATLQFIDGSRKIRTGMITLIK